MIEGLAVVLLGYIGGSILADLALEHLMGIKDPLHKQLLAIIWPLLLFSLVLYAVLLLLSTTLTLLFSFASWVLMKVFNK